VNVLPFGLPRSLSGEETFTLKAPHPNSLLYLQVLKAFHSGRTRIMAAFHPSSFVSASGHTASLLPLLEFLRRLKNETQSTHVYGNVHKVAQSPSQTHGSAYETQEYVNAQMYCSHIPSQSGKEDA
jgi:hypothetical protein